jgi:hypothetical protein
MPPRKLKYSHPQVEPSAILREETIETGFIGKLHPCGVPSERMNGDPRTPRLVRVAPLMRFLTHLHCSQRQE